MVTKVKRSWWQRWKYEGDVWESSDGARSRWKWKYSDRRTDPGFDCRYERCTLWIDKDGLQLLQRREYELNSQILSLPEIVGRRKKGVERVIDHIRAKNKKGLW